MMNSGLSRRFRPNPTRRVLPDWPLWDVQIVVHGKKDRNYFSLRVQLSLEYSLNTDWPNTRYLISMSFPSFVF